MDPELTMATKPAAQKAQKKSPAKAPSKASKAPASKSAKKPGPAKPAPAKVAAKPVTKAATKPAPAKAPAAAKSAKPAAKTAAEMKTAKPTPSAKSAKVATKEPPKKKLNVGQKPRSERTDQPIAPPTFITTPRDQDGGASLALKASPASKEAKQTFKVNDSIVYPAHGVGRIVAIEKQHIAGIVNELFVIDFDQEKLKLKVPTAKAISVGMRGLSDEAQVKKAIDLLKGRARIKRTMWSRRAQEYEAKINSGDILAVAEVVRDLYRATDQPEQSYSERQLFEAALDRLAREVAAVRKSDLTKAIADLDASLQQKKAA
jgi:CarD family transcriptional regulator